VVEKKKRHSREKGKGKALRQSKRFGGPLSNAWEGKRGALRENILETKKERTKNLTERRNSVLLLRSQRRKATPVEKNEDFKFSPLKEKNGF